MLVNVGHKTCLERSWKSLLKWKFWNWLNKSLLVLNSNLTHSLTFSNDIFKYKAIKRGSKIQFCFVLLEIMNGSDTPTLDLTEAIIPLWKDTITPSSLLKTSQRASLETVSMALMRSMKVLNKSFSWSHAFFCSCLKLKIISTVLLPDKRPCWNSEKTESVKEELSQFQMILPRTFPATHRG